MRRGEAWQAAEMIARNSNSRSGQPSASDGPARSHTVSAESGTHASCRVSILPLVTSPRSAACAAVSLPARWPVTLHQML